MTWRDLLRYAWRVLSNRWFWIVQPEETPLVDEEALAVVRRAQAVEARQAAKQADTKFRAIQLQEQRERNYGRACSNEGSSILTHHNIVNVLKHVYGKPLHVRPFDQTLMLGSEPAPDNVVHLVNRQLGANVYQTMS